MYIKTKGGDVREMTEDAGKLLVAAGVAVEITDIEYLRALHEPLGEFAARFRGSKE